ncbi:MAG TPA: hypothetical protein VHI13_06810 [Candidatus Kapabacteria bacterium]|nr:hypothetical protein [Candidatus Kapabacteria bacterium]
MTLIHSKEVDSLLKQAVEDYLGERRIRPEYVDRLTVSSGFLNGDKNIVHIDLLWMPHKRGTIGPSDPEWNEPMPTVLSFELDRRTGDIRLAYEDPIFPTLLEVNA